MKNGIYLIVASLLILTSCSKKTQTVDNFNWRKATVYFLMTDRFCNGDSTNDINYGRINDYGSERMNAATFHGGDWVGVYNKAKEGYFTKLGIDVVWLTDPYEQIHGWMSGSGDVNDFPHYGYHGYYPLDYTQTDKNYGTIEEFRALVDLLHSQGIRVMLGANINDPGYPNLLDAIQYKYDSTLNITEADAAKHDSNWQYSKWAANNAQWTNWWTSEWIRTNDEQWDQNNPYTATLYGLPDYKTEKTSSVKIPIFLKEKWMNEGNSNDKWVNPSAKKLRQDKEWSPSQYVIAWISSWVEEFGIDGFRCDIVENVEAFRWKELKDSCNIALNTWRKKHPEDIAAKWKDDVFFTGDFDQAYIDYKPIYAKSGFNCMVNFKFPKDGNLDSIGNVWQTYSDSLHAHKDWQSFSYLNNAYFRDANPNNMINCATTFLLSPGAIQIFYGDEINRKLSDARLNVDAAQAFRSDYNWQETDPVLYKHYCKLGQIRLRHPAIGLGKQTKLSKNTYLRTYDVDKIIISIINDNHGIVDTENIFPENSKIRNEYTGEISTVKNHKAAFSDIQNQILILSLNE